MEWIALEEIYRQTALRHVAGQSDDHRAFALGRIVEGCELAAHFGRKYRGRPLRILDAGAGIGGVALALANVAENFVVAVDVVPNGALREARARSGTPLRYVIASADALPFRHDAFDIVLCLETIEHLPRAADAARELMSVARTEVMLTTPPRARYLFRRDPHLGIRGLLLLPDAVQKWVAERLFRLGEYDVRHTFWLARSVIALFPGRDGSEVLVDAAWPPPPRRGKERWQLLRHHVRKRLRHFVWDRIVVYKRVILSAKSG
jgi:SAM-dependent methyltransferase